MTKEHKEAEYVSGPVHFLDSKKIEVGDILLSTDPNSTVSSIIRKKTGSPISHAAICTEAGFFIEALGNGVRRFAIDMMAVRDMSNIRVLRLREDVHDGQRIRETAGRKAERYHTRGFWRAGLTTSLLKSIQLQNEGAFFCSHLVAQAYQDAGLELVGGLPPDKTTPASILGSDKLIDITSQIVLPAVKRPRWQPCTLIDAPHRLTQQDKEVSLKQCVCHRISDSFHSHGLPKPTTFEEVLSLLEANMNSPVAKGIDDDFMLVLTEEQYFAFGEKSESDRPHDDFVAEGIQKIWDTEKMKEILEFSETLHGRLSQIVKDHDAAHKKFSRLATESGLKTFHSLARQYQRLLENATKKYAEVTKSIELLRKAIT